MLQECRTIVVRFTDVNHFFLLRNISLWGIIILLMQSRSETAQPALALFGPFVGCSVSYYLSGKFYSLCEDNLEHSYYIVIIKSLQEFVMTTKCFCFCTISNSHRHLTEIVPSFLCCPLCKG